MTAGCPGPVPEEKPRYLIRRAASGDDATGQGPEFWLPELSAAPILPVPGTTPAGISPTFRQAWGATLTSRAEAIKGKHQHLNDLVYGAK